MRESARWVRYENYENIEAMGTDECYKDLTVKQARKL